MVVLIGGSEPFEPGSIGRQLGLAHEAPIAGGDGLLHCELVGGAFRYPLQLVTGGLGIDATPGGIGSLAPAAYCSNELAHVGTGFKEARMIRLCKIPDKLS